MTEFSKQQIDLEERTAKFGEDIYLKTKIEK